MLEVAPRPGDSPFASGTTLQVSWDSTSLGAFKSCPRYYAYTLIEGWRPKGESVHLTFGTLFHKALEVYDLARAEGGTHGYGQEAAVATALEESYGWTSDHPKKNRETLLRSVIWYLEQYRDDPCKTIVLANGAPAVELSFKFNLDERYSLCGHLDRLVDYDGTLFVMDRKTTGSTIGPYFFSEFNPHNQMTLYTLASRVVFEAKVSGVIIDAAQVAIGFTAFGRGFTMRSESQLEEWLDDTRHWISLAERFAETGHYPRNEQSCHKYGGCAFRGICSKSPEVRDEFLRTDFEQTDPWNPLRNRGGD